MSFMLAKVADVHPSGNSIDVIMYSDGSRLSNVQVIGDGLSTRTGKVDLPRPDAPQSGDRWDLSSDSGTQDIIAIIGMIAGAPFCFGFVLPQICQMTFPDVGRMVYRHTSDVYFTIDSAGSFEFFHPSGAFMRFGASSAHEDLTGKDFDGKWKIDRNTGTPIHMHIEQAGGLASVDIGPDGAIVADTKATLTATATGNISATSSGGNIAVTASAGSITAKSPSTVTIDAPSTVCTGNLTVAKGFNVQGAGVSGAACSIAGSVAVTGGDVKADGIGLKSHTHTDPQGGTVGPASG